MRKGQSLDFRIGLLNIDPFKSLLRPTMCKRGYGMGLATGSHAKHDREHSAQYPGGRAKKRRVSSIV